MAIGVDRITNRPAYVQAELKGLDLIQLLSAGDPVPLLTGAFPNFTTSPTQTYTMAGNPDGLGLWEDSAGRKYVWMNHEFSSRQYNTTTGAVSNAGTVTDIQTTNGAGTINGARVSLFVFNPDWTIIGGKSLTEEVLYEGVTYRLNLTTGNWTDTAGNVLKMTPDRDNFYRFCSGYLAGYGFLDRNGNESPMYFAPEETGTGYGIPISSDGRATALQGLGLFSKENVVAHLNHRPRANYYNSTLSGGQEVPGNFSTASGKADVYFDRNTNTLRYSFTASGLDFGALVAPGTPRTPDPGDDVQRMHIHQGANGTNGSVVFNIYDRTNPNAIAQDNDLRVVNNPDGSTTVSGIWENAPATAANDLSSGNFYFNVHTNRFPSGEIRGQVARSGYTVLVSTEDNADGEVYVSVCKQTQGDPNGFSSDPALVKTYALQVVDRANNRVFGYETMAEDQEYIARFKAIPNNLLASKNPSAISTFVNSGDANTLTGNFNSTNFRRPEDVAYDPNNPNRWYFVTTGSTNAPYTGAPTFNNPFASIAGQPAQTSADNVSGKLNTFTLEIDSNGVPVDGTFKMLLQGGPRKGVSYDNITVDGNGNVLIQEDETAGAVVAMNADGRFEGTWRYNLAENANAVGTDRLDFVFENKQNAEGQQYQTGPGDWEDSGIITVNPNAQPGKASYLFDVQAHTMTETNAAQILGGRYHEGGQLLYALPRVFLGPEFNGDRNSDLLWRNTTNGQNAVWQMNGTTLGSSALLPTDTEFFWQLITAADLDNNGTSDLLWRNTTNGQNGVWRMNGTTFLGSFLLPTVADLNWQMVGTGDFNNDSEEDILWNNTATRETVIWYMNGTNYVSTAQSQSLPDTNWQITGTGNFNADSTSDILLRNKATGDNALWLMNGPTLSRGVFLPRVADLNWQMVGAGYFNYDSFSDIVWRNTTTGQNDCWIMQGSQYVQGASISSVPSEWQMVL